MKKGRPPQSLDRSYQFEICLWLAMGKTTRQIVDMVKDKYSLTMSFQNIDNTYRMSPRWKKVIEHLRTHYLKNISRIPIAQKANRLKLLEQAAQEALTWRTKTVNAHGVVQEMKIGCLPQIIAEARKEVEGEKVNITGSIEHNHKFDSLGDTDLDNLVRTFIQTTESGNGRGVRREVAAASN